ncbi:hypothetical protein TIFTF001_034723 [Ficus carica]|uniref:Retrotransposon gag domain-containing protein n=1 Tax=Ficus carica TaxID=3494 RepID=A0AA88E1U9_FICCA|nr:hypothetical protein TIFTF001_034723 [Ficus carica]
MPPRRRTAQTQDVDLAAQLNKLRQMMLAQQQEIGGLRAQLAQQNQGPPDAGVPPAPVNQPVAPEIPNADPVIPENPIAPEVPVVPLVVPRAPLIRRDVSQMTWEDFVDEFKEKYFNTEVMEAQQDEFTNFRQGNLLVAEAIKKFEQLARFCHHLIISERDKDKTENSRLSSLKKRKKRRPKLSRIRQDQAKLPSREVKEDLLVEVAIVNSTAVISRKENGIQEDRGINRILPKRKMLMITTVIPLVRNVEGSTWEISVLEPIVAICVVRKATMLGTVIPISRIRRTNRKVRDINFTQHR